MHMSVNITLEALRLLFKHARQWWRYHELRKQGKMVEARRWEQKDVRDYVRWFEGATVLHIGRGPWTLCRLDGARLGGNGGTGNLVVQAAIRAGVPAFDTSTVANEKRIELLQGPYPHDDALGALRHARSLGARVWNDPDDGEVNIEEEDRTPGLT